MDALTSALQAEIARRLSAAAAAGWSCPSCATTDGLLRYRSGRVRLCYDCQRFQRIVANCARQQAKYDTNPRRGQLVRPARMRMSSDEYLRWCREHDRVCAYCAITQAELPYAGQRARNGLTVEALGIDRVDNDRDYESQNIVWCCAGCNAIKSNLYTPQDMRELGPAAGRIYRRRVQHELLSEGVRGAAVALPAAP